MVSADMHMHALLCQSHDVVHTQPMSTINSPDTNSVMKTLKNNNTFTDNQAIELILQQSQDPVRTPFMCI